jgi:hypothetical protein
VRFSPPSINKNDKSDGERIANISLTEAPISIGPRNLESTRKTIPERNLRSKIQTRVGIDKKIGQLKKIEGYNHEKDRKKHYNNGNNNVRQENQSNVWMSRLRPRARPTIPGNSTEKHKRKLNSK